MAGFKAGREGKGHVVQFRRKTGVRKRWPTDLDCDPHSLAGPVPNSLRIPDYFEYPLALVLRSKSTLVF